MAQAGVHLEYCLVFFVGKLAPFKDEDNPVQQEASLSRSQTKTITPARHRSLIRTRVG